ncbi:uncharacterized protein NDAI_0D03480 [Naumovozyma dairenensis CBS 421]|uniref:Zn(2)-C6 fungal-type domain-containing protein n=1 Tax=Naumovozyma dairenensis (strain ATCC 10597 / BCRC 20456 / CBS 421 / NBRC 0211 / NRRL Y-12639) TaxID=1071378 RepID=G0WA51_NAUDC|nr:hypothetical protein NDAI_0D03480 [Naumovozyma dairenensis CBS 421]CCD24662.1 hypothetical protein NDAI_0D03480 [Naumovozyma dairenensis CBS 421]
MSIENRTTARVIKRKRLIKSCKYCYTHKLKCNKEKPCSKCIAVGLIDECIYGFDKGELQNHDSTSHSESTTPSPKLPLSSNSGKVRKIKTTNKTSSPLKSKYLYPFFTNSVNDENISSVASNDTEELSSKMSKNAITTFDRFVPHLFAITLEDIINLIPDSLEVALSQIDTYFETIHPIIPVLDRSLVRQKLIGIYNSIQSGTDLSISNLLLIMSIFFCSSYSIVASSIIPDLLLCNKYYQSHKYLLELSVFPTRPTLESLQSFLIVNFIQDPNMTEAIGYSVMLVRIAQQLGVEKKLMEHSTKQEDNIQEEEYQHLKLLWSYLLYIEGSASVVYGLPFMSEKFNPDWPMEKIPTCLESIPLEFTIGRLIINAAFYDIMEHKKYVEMKEDHEKLRCVYAKIERLNNQLSGRNFPHSNYFINTLKVFLYRLYLKYFGLLGLYSAGSKNNDNDNDKRKNCAQQQQQLKKNNKNDITWILKSEQVYPDSVIEGSLLLLFSTLKRLIEKDTDKFLWYTRGSTVMQYLFIILKDIYENPKKIYLIEGDDDVKDSLFCNSMDKDVHDVIKRAPVFYRYLLIEQAMNLLELKLAPLWKKDDIYKFMLVRTVKEKVWEIHSNFISSNESLRDELNSSTIFIESRQNIKNLETSVNFEEYLKQWEIDRKKLDTRIPNGNDIDTDGDVNVPTGHIVGSSLEAEQILIDWLSEFDVKTT